MRIESLAILVSVCALVAASDASALPRYSALYGQDCSLCHQDPTGGGLRTLYASQFLVPTELAARAPELDTLEPALGEHLVFGVDLRTLFVDAEEGNSTQLQMQSDLHLAVQVEDRTSIRMDVGQDGVHQAFGLAYFLPANGWLKVGRFTPNYGWRFADHQLFARRYVPATDGVRSPYDWESAGMEVGLSPGTTMLTASLDEGGALGESWTTSGLWRGNWGSFGLALGGSYLRRQDATGHRRSAGAHGLVRLGPAAWLAQWDEPREDGRRERVLTQELSLRVARGWTLRATHGFADPDRDAKNGARQRYGAGVDVLATPFFGFLAMANYDDVERGAAVTEESGWSADFVFHFLY